MSEQNNVCMYCGETREAIRKHGLVCAVVDSYGEASTQRSRHRFKPFSAQEVSRIQQAEREAQAGRW